METRRKMKLGTSDKVILGIGYTVLGIFVLSILIPLVYILMASFMDPNVLNSRGISLNFKDWTLDACLQTSSGKRYDLAWIFQFIFLFSGIYCDFCVYHTAGSLSYVKERICRKKIF